MPCSALTGAFPSCTNTSGDSPFISERTAAMPLISVSFRCKSGDCQASGCCQFLHRSATASSESVKPRSTATHAGSTKECLDAPSSESPSILPITLRPYRSGSRSSPSVVSVPDTCPNHAREQSNGDHFMTMASERTRALLWAGSLLVEIARDKALPLQLRRRAATIARHFPTEEDVEWLAASIRDSVLSIPLASPKQALPEPNDWNFEPLRHSTRLSWPDDL